MAGSYDVLIVGAGQSGAQTAITLRKHGFEGTIGILGEEQDLPYARPPLSKEYLAGGKPFERLLFLTAAAWEERSVSVFLDCRVVKVDASRRRVTIQNGETVDFGVLVWATGGHARKLEHGPLTGMHTIRNRADVDRLTTELPDVREVVVIGGGYIGLEAASVLVKLGKSITLIESQDRVLSRVSSPPLSHFFEAEHRSRGVDIRVNCAVSGIERVGEYVAGVRLAGGDVLPAQMVIVGIGIVPAVAPLIAAGAEGCNGVRVDEYCRTTLEKIYAVGDCAEHRSRFANGDWVRIESVQNANDQAIVAAKSICGCPETYDAVPWFWSNQYDLRLQTVGILRGYDEFVVRGEMSTKSFSVIYLREKAVIAMDCVNAIRDYTQGCQLVSNRMVADTEILSDAARPLKDLVGVI